MGITDKVVLFVRSSEVVYVVCFFFFQAEDGIRDIGVTGVQTCALPICRRPADYSPRDGEGAAGRGRAGPRSYLDAEESGPGLFRDRGGRVDGGDALRSEERRVGKEGRSRWSPYH